MSTSSAPIRDMTAGDRFEGTYLLGNRSEARTRNGKRYLQIELRDATGTINGKAWEVDAVPAEAMGGPVHVSGRVDAYQGRLQVIVDRAAALPPSEVDLSALLPSSRFSADELLSQLDALIASLQDPMLRALLEAVLAQDDLRARLAGATAARSIHHAYVGGLVEHLLSMAAAFQGLQAHYERAYPGLIDPDLLLAGVVLHDLGKVDEIDAAAGFRYTDEGQLLGHIAIGAQRVARAAAGIEGFPRERLVAVQHLILAHHGELEYGSPVKPRMAEAVLLHYLDQIDAKLNHAFGRMVEAGDQAWTTNSRVFDGPLQVPARLGAMADEPGRLFIDPAREAAPEVAAPPPAADPAKAEAARPPKPAADTTLDLFSQS